jgi:hypothetical protein
MIPEPELRIGFVIELDGRYFEITAIEPFNYMTGDEDATDPFSSVAASGSKDYTNISVLDPDEDPAHLYEVFWGVKTGGIYRMKLPAGTQRLGVDEDKDVGYVDMQRSPWFAPNPAYKFWLRHDRYPQIAFSNISTTDAITPKILFEGYKYDLQPATNDAIANMKTRGVPPKKIIVGGVKN